MPSNTSARLAAFRTQARRVVASGPLTAPGAASLVRQARQALGRGAVGADSFDAVRGELHALVGAMKAHAIAVEPDAQAKLNALDVALKNRTLAGPQRRAELPAAAGGELFGAAPALADLAPLSVQKNGLRQTAIAFWESAFSQRTAKLLAAEPTRAELARIWAAQRPNNAPTITNVRGLDLVVAGGNLVKKGDGTAANPDQILFETAKLAPFHTVLEYELDANGKRVPPVAGQADHMAAGIAAFVVSPDAKRVAVGTSVNGGDYQSWNVVDVASGKVLTDKPIFFKNFGGVNPGFSEDGKSLFYTGIAASQKRMEAGFVEHKVYRHDIDAPAQTDVVVHTPPDETQFASFALPKRPSGDSVMLLARSQGAAVVPDCARLLVTKPNGKQTVIDLFAPGQFEGNFLGTDGVRMFFRQAAPGEDYRVMSIHVDEALAAHAAGAGYAKQTRVVPPGVDGKFMFKAQMIGDKILAHYFDADMNASIGIFASDGTPKKTIQMADHGMKPRGLFGDFTGDATSTKSMFTFASAVQVPETFSIDMTTLDVKKEARADTVAFDPTKVTEKLLHLKNSDGSPFTSIVLGRNDLPPGEKHHALITLHYGHIGQPTTSMYNRNIQSFLEAGYAVCLVQSPGGGERGAPGYAKGRDNPDLILDAVDIATKAALPEVPVEGKRTVLTGRSWGGATTFVHAMRRGGFDAYVSVCATDQLTAGMGRHEDLVGHGPVQKLYDDMGPVRTADGNFAATQREATKRVYWHSPYDAVRSATKPQNIFLSVGIDDHRVGPLAMAPAIAAYIEKFGADSLAGIAHHRPHDFRAETPDVLTWLNNRYGVTTVRPTKPV